MTKTNSADTPVHARDAAVSTGVVLADFEPFQAVPPIAQEDANLLLSWGIAIAKCIRKKVQTGSEATALFNEVKAKVDRYGVSPKHIKQRQMILATTEYSSDRLHSDFWVNGAIAESVVKTPLFRDLVENRTNDKGPPLEERMELYENTVDSCLKKMYPSGGEPPDHMVHVSCSGYISPSPVEKLVSARNWLNTTVTHSYHMGCYGSLPAIRMAHGFLASSFLGVTEPKARIDIIHTELFSTHINLANDTAMNILTMSLFGDGFVKYSAYPQQDFGRNGKRGLKILALKEHLISDSLDGMTWNLGSHNFHMTLSIKVPLYIRDSVIPFVKAIFAESGLDFDAERENLLYAIHPGGPAIIDRIAEQLDLGEEDIAISRRVMFLNGNISSATLPYIFAEICADSAIPLGSKVLALAFGPGLTISGILLEKV